jgi:hypothetical protein
MGKRGREGKVWAIAGLTCVAASFLSGLSPPCARSRELTSSRSSKRRDDDLLFESISELKGGQAHANVRVRETGASRSYERLLLRVWGMWGGDGRQSRWAFGKWRREREELPAREQRGGNSGERRGKGGFKRDKICNIELANTMNAC